MRWLYLLKLAFRLPALIRIVPDPLGALWRVIWKNDRHRLRLSPDRLLERVITPPNLYGYLLLREGGMQPAADQPAEADRLLWQLTPQGTFLTRLTVGMDLMTLYELFVRRDYGTDFQDKVVLDVGAYNGDSAVYFALQGARRVIALEPYPPSFALAQENLQRMGLTDRVEIRPLALGAEGGRLRFQIASASPDANSLQPPDSPLQKLITYDTTVEVEVRALPALLDELGLEEVDFLKLDCEGCEFAVIGGLSAKDLQRVRFWHIEYHANPGPLVEKLRSSGFRVQRERDRGGVLGYLLAERIAE